MLNQSCLDARLDHACKETLVIVVLIVAVLAAVLYIVT